MLESNSQSWSKGLQMVSVVVQEHLEIHKFLHPLNRESRGVEELI